ncbi:lytic transglycosylase domain-containing protein [Rhodopseudomonas sp. NSM]|uniref:lytic transglycosylase domain-containing protein n=1 Tax=Rhodopseudomonas sp. NSM TaxID=3457630 RepID=UPI004035599E
MLIGMLRGIAVVLLVALTAPGFVRAEEAQPAKQSETQSKPEPQAKSDPAEPAAKPVEQPGEKPADRDTRESICLMIESAAKAHDLPLEFFARVIWQESRFQPDAIGPVTRNGQRAQGIAQFMPGTATERSLLDPFDPVQALPKSAEFLSELRRQFGNLGLAAAAYNAGPRRVQEWIAGTGPMPQQTRHYVYAITGTTVDDWAAAGRNTKPATQAAGDCRTLMALLRRAPNPFVTQLEARVKLAADKPWGVQLAAGFNRDRALAMYARAMSRLSAVIGDHDPSLSSLVFRSRGTRPFYRVRIGAETRPEANELCNRIRRAGSACLVLRNRG